MASIDELAPQQTVDDMVAQPGAAFGTTSPGEAGATAPTWIDKLVRGVMSALGTLPRRAIQNSQFSMDTGTYDPAVPVEAAMTAMTGGVAGAPARAGEAVLGSGPPRRLQSEVAEQFKRGPATDTAALDAEIERLMAERQAKMQAAMAARRGKTEPEVDMTPRARSRAPVVKPPAPGGPRLESAVMRQYRESAPPQGSSLEGSKLIPVDHDPFKEVP